MSGCELTFRLRFGQAAVTAMAVALVVTFYAGSLSGTAQTVRMEPLANGARCQRGVDSLEITAVATNILRLDIRPGGIKDDHTPMLDPEFHGKQVAGLRLTTQNPDVEIDTDSLKASLDCAAQTISVADGSGDVLLSFPDVWTNASQKALAVHRSAVDPMYGMAGIPRFEVDTSVERPQGSVVKAGAQGNAGAPFFFTKKFGVLVDSIDGQFSADGSDVTFKNSSRSELEVYILVGNPMSTMSGLADLTGHPPMPPRWTLGFINSQWGIDEDELKKLVGHYRASHIPLDAFIIDYDWKAWGEDNYGEWRWNSTNAPGNVQPNKFPDGASGVLGKQMQAKGVYLAGILKPRILLYKEGTTEFLDAAGYADAHHFWYPGVGPKPDQRTRRPSKNLDFSQPAERVWFWSHLEPSFKTGMVGWWNDEADELPDKISTPTSSLEFFNMGRALYEGQRSTSSTRVWSLNRNFYLGAQRFGYAEWSGDIKTGEASMASQPPRMLATLNVGEPHWSMDTGGFIGDPTSEEYARWMEFAAFTPIARVHAGHNQKRQPWVFGPIAEAAATHAMRLRYSLLPYIYSAEHACTETGIGVARPLEWMFPDDPSAAQQVNEWMFGDALLVAPILDLKAATRQVYLPAGQWREYATGKAFTGGQAIAVNTDVKNWSDIPLFVRENSILATEEPGDDIDAMHPAEITLDIFPSSQGVSSWTMYDDDGATYNYEHGTYFKQRIKAEFSHGQFSIDMSAPEGTFVTSVQTYRLRVHSVTADSLHWKDRLIAKTSSLGSVSGHPVWTESHDRFGVVAEVRLKAGVATHVDLSAAKFKDDGVSSR